MPPKPTGRQIAAALGVSPGRVSQLRKEGMPVESIEAAWAWVRRRIDPARSIAQRNAPRRRAASQSEPADDGAALARAASLAAAAHYALAVGGFSEIEDELRAALRAVPLAERAALELPIDVFEELTRAVFDDMQAHEESGDRVEGLMSDEEAEWMGRFWFAVAAGEVGLPDE